MENNSNKRARSSRAAAATANAALNNKFSYAEPKLPARERKGAKSPHSRRSSGAALTSSPSSNASSPSSLSSAFSSPDSRKRHHVLSSSSPDAAAETPTSVLSSDSPSAPRLHNLGGVDDYALQVETVVQVVRKKKKNMENRVDGSKKGAKAVVSPNRAAFLAQGKLFEEIDSFDLKTESTSGKASQKVIKEEQSKKLKKTVARKRK